MNNKFILVDITLENVDPTLNNEPASKSCGHNCEGVAEQAVCCLCYRKRGVIAETEGGSVDPASAGGEECRLCARSAV